MRARDGEFPTLTIAQVRTTLSASNTIPTWKPSPPLRIPAIPLLTLGRLVVRSSSRMFSFVIGQSYRLCSREFRSRFGLGRRLESLDELELVKVVLPRPSSGWSRYAVGAYGSMDDRSRTSISRQSVALVCRCQCAEFPASIQSRYYTSRCVLIRGYCAVSTDPRDQAVLTSIAPISIPKA
jgi:hypothetical protein